MSIEVKVPQLPESVADATLVAWHKKPGEAVGARREPGRPGNRQGRARSAVAVAGVIKEIKVENGATVTSGQVLAILEAGERAAAAPAKPRSRRPAPAAAAPAETKAAAAAAAANSRRRRKRMVEEHKLDAGQIAGSGRDGRVSKGDVDSAHGRQGSRPRRRAARRRSRPPRCNCRQSRGTRNEQRVPMTRLRARIAERLIQAQSTAAMLTTFNEVDLTAVNEIRARYKDKFEKAHGVKLGFMSFFVKAVDRGAAQVPGGQRVDRRQRHRLSRLLRHRRRGLHRHAA